MVIWLDEIQKLSVSERLALIEALWESIARSNDPLVVTDGQRQESTGCYQKDPPGRSGWTPADDPDYRPGHYAMRLFKARPKEEEEQLIEKHIGLDNERCGGRADARLRSGPSVWAIVSFFDMYKGDLDEITGHFDISQEELEAALAFYLRNKKYIDARILVNEA
jgi:uncharacterized protein (DUF433 family)